MTAVQDRRTGDVEDASPSPLLEEVRWATGSYFMAFFPVALFDQAMHPSVSAGLEVTGRIRNDAVARGVRSAASGQILDWGHDADREREFARLRELHRAVKGAGPDGTRYSALTPENWNLILVSTIRMSMEGVQVILGRRFDDAEKQEVYTWFLGNLSSLQLPGKSAALPDTWAEAMTWYDDLVEHTLENTVTVQHAFAHVRRPDRPDFLPAVAHPVWVAARPAIGQLMMIAGLGTTAPAVRAKQGQRWGAVQRLQFSALTTGIRLAHTVLPKRLTLTQLAHNRWEYEHLIAKYRRIGLESFAPDTQ